MIRWLLRRAPTSRHELGAAVTGLPTAPRQAPSGLLPAPAPVAAPVPEPVAVVAAAALDPPAGRVAVRVELGFRDGTSLCLPSASTEATALLDLAARLRPRG